MPSNYYKDMEKLGKRSSHDNAPNAKLMRQPAKYQSTEMVTAGSVSKVEKKSKPHSMTESGYEKVFRQDCHANMNMMKSHMSKPDSLKKMNY